MPLSQQLAEYISACFTGLWVQSQAIAHGVAVADGDPSVAKPPEHACRVGIAR